METKSLSLYHIIKAPKGQTEKAPCLIMLHGYGSNEEDLFSFASELPEQLFIISVRAPHLLPQLGYSWYSIQYNEENIKWVDDEQAKQSRDAIAKFIDQAIDAYPIKKDNISLLGFSQGAILSFAVGLSYPKKVKNIIGLSGYINQAIIKNPTDDYQHLNIYSSNGIQDQLIPISLARKTPDFLKAKNIQCLYEEFPVGHTVAPQNFYSFKKWLEKRL